MKRIAILVIADTSQPVYNFYLRSLWPAMIRYLSKHKPHIDVYLLFEHNTDTSDFTELEPNIIRDPRSDFKSLCEPRFQNKIIPGILSKTIHAFRKLKDDYDVFFRTNLSTMIRVTRFDEFIQSCSRIVYSGGMAWHNALRENLLYHDYVGESKNIQSIDELDAYPGNTFISGSGYLLSAKQVESLLERENQLRYDLPDDVAVGLMFGEYQYIEGFTCMATPGESVPEIKQKVRNGDFCVVRFQHFPLPKIENLWRDIAPGYLWKFPRASSPDKRRFNIFFPRFNHIENISTEMRLVAEGLRAHPRVDLVREPQQADYVMLCQNHLVEHNPFHSRFVELKDRFKEKTIMMDFQDWHAGVLDPESFQWKLYFKRSCADRRTNLPVDYGDLNVIPTAYAVEDAMVIPPAGNDLNRKIDIACLFEDSVTESPYYKERRGGLLKLARQLQSREDYEMVVGTVSDCGPIGRSETNQDYKNCLYQSKIILHANPDKWEGDSRTWEALCSGALVFIDRMCQPISHPLVDGKHVVFYDPTDKGFELLKSQIAWYLDNDEERERIGRQGRDFVLRWHRSVNRINEVIWQLESEIDDANELANQMSD